MAVKESAPKAAREMVLTIGRRKVTITHPDKLYFPDDGITKGMVAAYYQQVSDYIMPYLKNRPESLRRTPNGIKDEGFFQKDAGGEAPEWVKSIELYSESVNKDIDYILCNDKATLAYLNNLGCIEINPWHSVVSSLDKPDYLILDIDPSDKNTFGQVIEAAQVFHEILEKAGAESFCKTSGATGLHVYIPMGRKYEYEDVKNFAELLCHTAHEQIPSFTSMERNLAKRGKDKIYLDFLQNRKGQTICSVYSLRPKAGATVSTPLQWTEVKDKMTPADFNIHTVPPRLEKIGDIFKPVLGKGIDLKKVLKNLPGS
ncbi:non-homologous end-joining DNA ligase [Chitinophagaceae bacterium MMS25-I14]